MLTADRIEVSEARRVYALHRAKWVRKLLLCSGCRAPQPWPCDRARAAITVLVTDDPNFKFQ